MLLSDAVILGMLAAYPSSGYDMKTELESGGAGLLSALNFGSIYPRLKALEAQGLIVTREGPVGGRVRKMHDLTADGWETLAAWLGEPATYPIPMRDDLLLKMVFWGAGRPDDRATLVEHLAQRRTQSRELLNYITTWPTNGTSYISEGGMLVLDHFRMRLEAELTWIERAIAQLEGPPRGPAQDPRGLAKQQRERRTGVLVQAEKDGGTVETHEVETAAHMRAHEPRPQRRPAPRSPRSRSAQKTRPQ